MKRAKLQAARYHKGFSQEALAEQMGVSRNTISQWENGHTNPYPLYVGKLCTFFSVSDPTALDLERHLEQQDVSNQKQPVHTEDKLFQQSSLLPAKALVVHDISVPSQPVVSNISYDPFSLAIPMLFLAQQSNQWSLDELLARVSDEMRKHYMQPQEWTRRETLKLLATLALTFRSSSTDLSSHETLPLLATSITAGWQLYYSEGNLQEIRDIIAQCIIQIESIKATSYQQVVVSTLSSQAYQLAAMISLEYEDYATAVAQANRAIVLAQVSHDPNTLVSAITRKTTVLYYQKRYRQISNVLQQAVPYFKQVTPLMQARIYSDLSADITPSTTIQDVTRYAEQALDLCPSEVEVDPTYAYTYTSRYLFYLNREIGYSQLGLHKQAWTALEHAEQFVTSVASTRRLELLAHQIATAIHLGNLDITTVKMQEMIRMSKIVNTQLWYSHIEELYQQMYVKWRRETPVKEIGEMLQKG